MTGLTSADNPDDPAIPGDKVYWESGDVVGYVGSWGHFSPDHAANARLAEWNDLLVGLPLAGAASNPWAPPRGEVAQVLGNLMPQLP